MARKTMIRNGIEAIDRFDQFDVIYYFRPFSEKSLQHKFEKLMEEQKQRARANWKGSGDKKINLKSIEKYPKNEFVGYEYLEYETPVVAVFDEELNEVDELKGNGWVLLEKTPFLC